VLSAKKKRPVAEINVVPYVDVMLVLLVIFMVTAPMINQGVDVNLPTANAKALNAQSELPIVISVDKHGEIFLNISENPLNAMYAKTLQVEVAAALLRSPKRLVSVRADKDANYANVLRAMVLLQDAGVANIGLETSPNAA